MAEEKFILLNLEDVKSKELAQAISSETARKILNLLADKPLSESDIAAKLNIPLPTAHYNIQQLLKANIIEIKDFLWSEKGKKIQLYQLANKLIIIAPKTSSPSFLEKIKDIIPVALVGFVASAALYTYEIFNKNKLAQPLTENLQPALTQDATYKSVVAESFSEAVSTSTSSHSTVTMQNLTTETVKVSEPLSYATWFFIGFITIIIIYLIFAYIRSRRKR